MDQKVISLPDKVQVVERDPEELSNYLVEELVDLVHEPRSRKKPALNQNLPAGAIERLFPESGTTLMNSG